MDEKHKEGCECCSDQQRDVQQREAQQSDESPDFMHNPPTDRETLARPEALDDLADLRHLE